MPCKAIAIRLTFSLFHAFDDIVEYPDIKSIARPLVKLERSLELSLDHPGQCAKVGPVLNREAMDWW